MSSPIIAPSLLINILLVITMCSHLYGSVNAEEEHHPHHHVYLNQFGVHIEGGHHQADRVARETGMKNLGQVSAAFQINYM